jgi:hypothetical protein
LLERWLAARGARSGAWIAWGWCPLVALEFAGAGHFDSLGIALLLSAFSPTAARSGRCAALWLAGAVGIKLLPLCFAPWLPRRSSSWRVFALFAVACVLVLAPMAWSWSAAPTRSALFVYATWWESTSAVYGPLEAALSALAGRSIGGLAPSAVARGVCAVAAIALLSVLLRRRAAPEAAVSSATAALLLLSPTFHPWYATWAVAWLPLAPLASGEKRAPAAAPAVALLAALAPAQYVMLERWLTLGEWSAPSWLWALMFAGPLVLLLRAAARGRAG